MTEEEKKEAIMALRASRKRTTEAVKERVKAGNALRKRIVEALSAGPKTVPELALETGIPSQDVLWHLTSMKKYGKAAEGVQSGDYFKYILLGE